MKSGKALVISMERGEEGGALAARTDDHRHSVIPSQSWTSGSLCEPEIKVFLLEAPGVSSVSFFSF